MVFRSKTITLEAFMRCVLPPDFAHGGGEGEALGCPIICLTPMRICPWCRWRTLLGYSEVEVESEVLKKALPIGGTASILIMEHVCSSNAWS